MTNCYIIRQKDGPYVVDLNIKKLKKALPELRVWNDGQKLMLSLRAGPTLFDCVCVTSNFVSNQNSIERVGAKYRGRSDDELKRIVYLTAPMRQILRREKYRRENLFNVPIDFTAVRTDITVSVR
jgi:hypothetical protein